MNEVSSNSLNVEAGMVGLTLRVKDDFAVHYNRNSENKLRGEQVLDLLGKGVHVAFFQKQKPEDDTANKARHRIIIPIGDNRAIEAKVFLWIDKVDMFTELYSYRVGKFKEIHFFNEPVKNTIKRTCSFEFKELTLKAGTSSEDFKNLFKAIESCEIPLAEVNKEKDINIWKNYVVALKKLIRQKEQVWKIQNVSTPYSEKNAGDGERANYIDIFIDEKGLILQLEKDIKSLFNHLEVEDYGVSEEKAFIEFKNFRELGQEERTKLKEIGEELFYDLSNSSPVHYISGEVTFKYSDVVSKAEIYEELKNRLQTEYQLSCSISSEGNVTIENQNEPHLKKVISDSFGDLLELSKENVIRIKVDFKNEGKIDEIKNRVKQKLNAKGFERANVKVGIDQKLIEVELGAYIPPNEFIQEDLSFIKAISRFKTNSPGKNKEIPGFQLSGGEYRIENATKTDADNALKKLSEALKSEVRRLPTIYIYQISNKISTEKLRNFKTITDLKDRTEFSLQTSIISINANTNEEYESHCKRIVSVFPSAILEEKKFVPSYHFKFKTDVESQRQGLISKIQNEIRKQIASAIEFDVIKNHTRMLFSYQFHTETDRDLFKNVVQNCCTAYNQIISFSFENVLGRTTYELIKNESLELEKEKEVVGNIRQATFIYLSGEQREQLSEALERFGDEAVFREGTTIGKLIRKDKNRLKFKITDDFDNRINAREKDRLDLTEMRKGYIKPIFPGELTNIGRMIRAMKKVTEPGARVGYPVNKNLSNFLFDPNEARQSSESIEDEKQRILGDLNEPLLKDQSKQLEAVAKTLLAKDMSLIQGPPGTGKTTVIAEIIWQFLLREPTAKILITSQTNLAVDNALERIKGKKLVRPVRIGNIDKFEDEGKVYSNDKIKKWLQAKEKTTEEISNADNAVFKWIEAVRDRSSSEEKYSNAITKWKKGLTEKSSVIKEVFAGAYYKHVNVFAATCSECGSPRFGEAFNEAFQKNSENKSEPEFDLVIMDEASKATPPELVLPLTLGKKVVIIGDHKQLPPMIDEQEFGEALETVGAKSLIEHWTKEDYKISQFEKLFKNAPKNFVTSLDTQFRMHEQIMNCISQFYTDQEELENGLICGIKNEMDVPDFNMKASRWHGLKSEPFIDHNHHAIWVNVEEPENRVGTSFENIGEIEAIQIVLRNVTKAQGFSDYFNHFKKDEDKEIGIITFYSPQMQNIRNALYPTFGRNEWRNFEQFKFENEFQIPFRINTVDRFQGMERNIIIISTVRSNKQNKEEQGKTIQVDNNKYPFALGFARELQRINVGFSRAKRLLIIVGNEKHFSNKPEYAQAIRKMHRIDLMQIQNLAIK
jgi:hypothetical protein